MTPSARRDARARAEAEKWRKKEARTGQPVASKPKHKSKKNKKK